MHAIHIFKILGALVLIFLAVAPVSFFWGDQTVILKMANNLLAGFYDTLELLRFPLLQTALGLLIVILGTPYETIWIYHFLFGLVLFFGLGCGRCLKFSLFVWLCPFALIWSHSIFSDLLCFAGILIFLVHWLRPYDSAYRSLLIFIGLSMALFSSFQVIGLIVGLIIIRCLMDWLSGQYRIWNYLLPLMVSFGILSCVLSINFLFVGDFVIRPFEVIRPLLLLNPECVADRLSNYGVFLNTSLSSHDALLRAIFEVAGETGTSIAESAKMIISDSDSCAAMEFSESVVDRFYSPLLTGSWVSLFFRCGAYGFDMCLVMRLWIICFLFCGFFWCLTRHRFIVEAEYSIKLLLAGIIGILLFYVIIVPNLMPGSHFRHGYPLFLYFWVAIYLVSVQPVSIEDLLDE